MPELPDVQVFKEYLDATSLHRVIERVRVSRPDILKETTAQALGSRLKGRNLESSRRHGKYLFAEIGEDGGWLVLHFGMTGYLDYSAKDEAPEHTCLSLEFGDGSHLAFVCMRMLGEAGWTAAPEDFIKSRELGIDAMSDELDFTRFDELLGSKRGSIKPALMDQSMIAGVGNVYADEILFQAKIHPGDEANKLDKTKRKEIYQQMRRVLPAAIEARVDPQKMRDSFLLSAREGDEPECPRCGARIEKTTISGRTSYFCPQCQKPS